MPIYFNHLPKIPDVFKLQRYETRKEVVTTQRQMSDYFWLLFTCHAVGNITNMSGK